jgi:hypothetical protein
MVVKVMIFFVNAARVLLESMRGLVQAVKELVEDMSLLI